MAAWSIQCYNPLTRGSLGITAKLSTYANATYDPLVHHGDVRFNAGNMAALSAAYCSVPPPIVTRGVIFDQVNQQAIGTQPIVNIGAGLQLPWFTINGKCVAGNVDGMSEERRDALDSYTMISASSTLFPFQINASDIAEYVFVMKELSSGMDFVSGLPPNRNGSPAAGLEVTICGNGCISDCEIGYNAGYEASEPDIASALLLKFRGIRGLDQLVASPQLPLETIQPL